MAATASRIEQVRGRALAVPGDDIDTDRILPARFLKAITFDGLERHVFEDDRREAAGHGAIHPFDEPVRAGAVVLLVGANFGCGSSREHAPRAIHQWGIQAIVGESFAEIFLGNALAIGLPCVAAARPDLDKLIDVAMREPNDEFALDLQAQTVAAGRLTVPVTLPDEARRALTSGRWDATVLLLDRYDEIDAVTHRLPYLHGF